VPSPTARPGFMPASPPPVPPLAATAAPGGVPGGPTGGGDPNQAAAEELACTLTRLSERVETAWRSKEARSKETAALVRTTKDLAKTGAALASVGLKRGLANWRKK